MIEFSIFRKVCFVLCLMCVCAPQKQVEQRNTLLLLIAVVKSLETREKWISPGKNQANQLFVSNFHTDFPWMALCLYVCVCFCVPFGMKNQVKFLLDMRKNEWIKHRYLIFFFIWLFVLFCSVFDFKCSENFLLQCNHSIWFAKKTTK